MKYYLFLFIGILSSQDLNSDLFSESGRTTGSVGTVFIWSLVDDSQSITWSAVDDSQTVTWSEVDDSQTPDWLDIAA